MTNDFAKQLIKKHESRRLRVYDDGDGLPVVPGKLMIGHPTIGWGRCLDTKGISADEATDLFENDYVDAEIVIGNIYGLSIFREKKERVAALLSMAHNLGEYGLKKFLNMNHAIMQRNWKEAAKEAENSLWYRQTGIRAREIVELLKEE